MSKIFIFLLIVVFYNCYTAGIFLEFFIDSFTMKWAYSDKHREQIAVIGLFQFLTLAIFLLITIWLEIGNKIVFVRAH